ncbi:MULTISPECIES: hypothetical protein [unclassified Rhizobium]|uniref:hypothetical protein n=1 Tax=unclassified Rhizobium TaxID=2613769 RepID=UPI000CDF4D5B|nr:MULTISPECIES: hypothetical protein [Rhizobium]AVA20387.1 hypothetical protein NXC24_CH00716 [Rhizobium sp. NXC24]MDK4742108.1 hypothetical protein [Rhizobium sp. CNPSo 3464]UWU21677.1 hypothetical protein N2601_01450 [Rhizobium tropici]
MAIAGLLGAACGVCIRAFDFWSLGWADALRGLLDLFGVPLLFLAAVVTLFVWSISALIALCHRRFRGMASSVIAVVIVPVSVVTIGGAPLFDPWLWYVIFNKSSLEPAAAANGNPQNSPKFTIVEERDVSTGIAGVTSNHFITLIYSESDPGSWAPPDADVRHIYGNFYRRDEFE